MENLFGSFKEMIDGCFAHLEQQVLPIWEKQLTPSRDYLQTEVLPFYNTLLFAVKGREKEEYVGVDIEVRFQYYDYRITDYHQIMEMARKRENVYYLVNCGQCKGAVLYGKIAIKDNPNFESELKNAFIKICQCLRELAPFIIDEIQTCYLDNNGTLISDTEQ